MVGDWRPFIFGGMASMTAEFVTFPIDTTKTRLQIQGQNIDQTYTKLRYNGMKDAFLKIFKEEGIKALYSGIQPALLRQATYGTIKFGTYYTLKSILNVNSSNSSINSNDSDRTDRTTESVGSNMTCAIIAGALSSAIANPTDVLKVRMQAQGRTGHNLSLINSFKQIYQLEGIRGLWRGVNPTAQRAAIIAAVELPVYDFCKSHLMKNLGDSILNHIISSFIASLGAAVASTPVDVIRTRMMNQSRVTVINGQIAAATHIYNGSIHCAIHTCRNEGFRALYKGFIPTMFRMGPWNIIFFITYEQLKKI